MADDLAVLFKIKAQNQASPVVHAVDADIHQLNRTFGSQFPQMQQVATVALGQITSNLTNVTSRIPILGSTVNLLTNDMAGLSVTTTEAGAATASLAGPIGIAIAAIAAEIVVVVKLTEAIFDLAKASADYQGKLKDLSQQTGVSVETLSALEVVARTTGSSIEGLTQSLGIFQRKIEEAVDDSNSKAAKSFRELNVEVADTETTLRRTVAALANMPEGFHQTALALEVFGRGGKAFLAIAKEANGDIDEITRRMGNLGLVTTEQAELADKFNDQLVILEVQLRGLGTRVIPVVLAALEDISKALEENRDLFRALQGIVQVVGITIFGPLRAALLTAKAAFEAVQPALLVTVGLLQKMKEAVEFISGHPISFGSGPATPAVAPTSPTPAKDPFTKQLEDETAAHKRLQNVLNAEFADRQKQAEASIATAQREFEAGKRTRQQLLDATLDGNRKQTKAALDQLQVERDIKLKELALAKDDIQKRDQIATAIAQIDIQAANKRSDLQRQEADLRARFQEDGRKADLAHEQARLEVLTKAGQDKIAVIEEQLRLERVDREAALKEIEEIENKTLQAKGQLLKKELELAGVGPDRQVVLDKIKAIENERTALERQQSQRRIEITREEFGQKRQILTGSIDTLLQIERVQGEAQIAAIQALARLRVTTEEQAARDVLAIRIGLIDSEIEATKAKLEATKGIVDPKQRAQEAADLNNQLKILSAERVATQRQGNSDIGAARQEDIENEREYYRDLRDIRERIRNIERDAAEEMLRLMKTHFASRKSIIQAQTQLDIQDENERHRQAEQEIADLEAENREAKRTAEERLAAEQEINRLREAEEERHRLATKQIKDQGTKDEQEADPLGRLKLGGDSLEEFAANLEQSIVPLGDILSGTFDQIAQSIGSVVEQWVLLGDTGPAVMRKILAVALATIAKEAAINAVKELALGFAMLFLNPADSAAHFTAAALWGSIAGGAAIAGRGVAGDLFKSKTGGIGGGDSGGSQPGQLNPITLGRNQPQPQTTVVHVHLSGEAAEAFNYKVVKAVVDNHRGNGEIRDITQGDGEP